MKTRASRTGLLHLCGLLLVAALSVPMGAAAQTTVKYVHVMTQHFLHRSGR
jgi:hypothetical protein